MNALIKNEEIDKDDVKLNVLNDVFIEYMKNEIQDNMLFKAFFKNLRIMSFENNEVIIFFPKVYPDLYNFKKYYNDTFTKAVNEVFGEGVSFKVIDKDYLEASKTAEKAIKKADTFVKKTNSSSINSQYTFDNYVESKFNKEALNICKAIADGDYTFNVLFISGNSGLGKTHLLKALENDFIEKGKKVYLVNPNTFTHSLTSLLKENDQKKLLNIHKSLVENYDLVLFDDFQLFGEGNKKSTKDFIFQILDGRMERNKITVFCSDRDINQIASMFDNRLITRFQSGFITKIKQPDTDDLSKILDFFLDDIDLNSDLISEEAKDFIIRNHTGSVRTLLGAVKRISHYKQDILNTPQEYIYKTITSIFEDVIQQQENITPDVIIKAVSKYYKIPTKDILSNSRKAEIVVARHIAMYMISIQLDYSSTELGKVFKKDHSTVLNALRKFKESDDESLKRTIQELKNQIYKIN
ncbi:chromosomal replication initiator protein DnaA [Mycoplasmopsis verecunda]|uniref:Chromosomal replication initiator protein DnaA n=1 Tax=Mycoplasmopsis verecunda TaxID=171291 RepID=A0A1T4LQ03_9BACT|nr:chromosomal replication initiator protein DnaA [Mycoplasmopsis verecunda]WPB54542.1 chromosomal replication initiator protein DnaA [Mycoplasmopsis verecunda]SJZ56618.1 chromosomal replication initiator protein [Mycoplasmopsis verecunda]